VTAHSAVERLARHTGPARTLDQLTADAWRAVTARTKAGKPVTAVHVADDARITRGAALDLLHRWTAEGRLTSTATTRGSCTGPYQATYVPLTTPVHTEVPPAMPTPTATPRSTAPPVRPAGPARADAPALLAAALEYAARGWHVFPLRPGDKRPAFPDHAADRCARTDPRCRNGHTGWEQRATTDPDRITRGWSRSTPAGPYGIGIATGPSRLVVVDLDTPKPDTGPPPGEWALPGVVDGADVFTVLCERAGQSVPDTYAVTTGRGGRHLYFTHPDTSSDAGSDGAVQLRNTGAGSPNALGWLIDTRAHGGYVVAPPTVVNGNPYTADDPTAPVLALPDWLTTALTPAPLPAQEPVTISLAAGRAGKYLEAAVEACLTAVRTSPDHGHNQALYGAAVALGQLVAGGALDADEVTAALVAAGMEVGQPEGQAGKTVASGMRAGANRPRRIPGVTVPAVGQEVAA